MFKFLQNPSHTVFLLALSVLICFQASAQQTAEDAWDTLVPSNLAQLEAFDYVVNDPDLPNVLVYGDSISIHYMPHMRAGLADVANVYRIHKNGGSSLQFINIVNELEATMRDPSLTDPWDFDWDIVYFNVGLHDLKYIIPGGTLDKVNGSLVSTTEEYAQTLEAIITYLRQNYPTTQLIFTTTTPVPDGEPGRFEGDAVAYNRAALEVFNNHPDIIINDLYRFTEPNAASWYVKAGDVHYNNTGRAQQGAYVAGVVSDVLNGDLGPRVASAHATAISCSEATLNGELITSGSEQTELRLIWGDDPAGLDLNAWDNNILLGSYAAGSSSSNSPVITGLSPDTTYYYRFYASNANGDVWSELVPFTTWTAGHQIVAVLPISQDVHISQNGVRFPSTSEFIVGNSTGANAGTADKRGFLKFDLSGIQAGWQIHSATIRFYHIEGANDNNGNATLYRVTTAWDMADVPYNHPIGNVIPGSAIAHSGPFDVYRTIDVTQAIQDYQTDPNLHHGFSMRGTEGFNKTGKYFVSSQGIPEQQPQLVIVYSDPTQDSDGDGIADQWECEHLGGLIPANSTSNQDGDSNTDAEEFGAGTDPNDASSSFQSAVQSIDPEMGEIGLRWSSVAGRTYAIQKVTDLRNVWLTIKAGIAATPPNNTETISTDSEEDHAFYRVVVE